MNRTLEGGRQQVSRQNTPACQGKFWQTAHVRKNLLLLSLVLVLSACTSASKGHSYSISQNDVTSITLKDSAEFSAKRVVVVANGVAEILSSLNATSILVGRDISSTQSALKDVPIVTSGHQVMAEKVISLKPDLVIIDASTGPHSAIEQIKKAGIRVVQTPESWTLTDIEKKITAVGAAIGAESQAMKLNQLMSISFSQSTVTGSPRIAFLYLRGTSSIYLIGGPGSGADSLINSIGALDVGAQIFPHPFNTLTAESLATANPDIILVMSKGLESVGGISGLLQLPGVAQTAAGKNARIIDVDDSLLLAFGTRTPSLVQALSLAVTKVMQ